MAEFPAVRFREAGASPAELEQLAREYGRSDATAQSALAGFASQPTMALTDHLDVLRASGHFGEQTVDEAQADEPSSLDDEEAADEADAPDDEADVTLPE